jgi:pimeloyl-ACP methyl ester carboxylesterase
MPKAYNDGVGVYYEVEGHGPPLVLQHTWAASLEYWREFGYTEALKDEYTLVLIDARGHGRSDVPDSECAYDNELMAADILSVLDALGIDRAHFAGYSMGAWIGFLLGIAAPERLFSMTLGGAHPYGQNLDFLRVMASQNGAGILKVWDSRGLPMSEALRSQLLNHPDLPLKASVRKDRHDISDLLWKLRMPVLMYVGEKDFRHNMIERCAKELPHAQFACLPELTHPLTFTRGDLVVPILRTFLREHKTHPSLSR